LKYVKASRVEDLLCETVEVCRMINALAARLKASVVRPAAR
jgi:hypothetical protein